MAATGDRVTGGEQTAAGPRRLLIGRDAAPQIGGEAGRDEFRIGHLTRGHYDQVSGDRLGQHAGAIDRGEQTILVSHTQALHAVERTHAATVHHERIDGP